jgi:hypothetical protein
VFAIPLIAKYAMNGAPGWVAGSGERQQQRQQQIPYGDDNKKGNGNCNGNDNSNDNSRSPTGMTTRKAKA